MQLLVQTFIASAVLAVLYVDLYGSHLFTPSSVVENAQAKVVAWRKDMDVLQIVVEAPSVGIRKRMVLIETPRTSYWLAFQWPDVASDTLAVDVCHLSHDPTFVDVNCETVRWMSRLMNFTQLLALFGLLLGSGLLFAGGVAMVLRADATIAVNQTHATHATTIATPTSCQGKLDV